MIEDIIKYLDSLITNNLINSDYVAGFVFACKEVKHFIETKLENTSYIGEFKINKGDLE